ncbi:MAG: DUF3592 domain-containing protein [Erysipelotrichales bacterium]
MAAIYIITTIFIIIGIVMVVVGARIKKKEELIKNARLYVEGEVIKYSSTSGNPPLVEYYVDGVKYRRPFRYTLVTTVGRTSNEKYAATNDIMDTKLKVYTNSEFSINTLMRDNFPIGKKMKVFYDEDNPKLSYVERYARSIVPNVLLFSGAFTMILGIINIILTKFIF